MTQSINRRTILRGAGVSMLLPLMESLSQAGAPVRKPPRRLIFLNFGFGPSESWYPDTADAGPGFTLPDAMQPLARHRDSFSVLSNLTNVQATGTGSHWGCTTFLTGADVRRSPGREFHNDISCDQIAAAQLGAGVRHPHLALTGPDKDVVGAGPGASMAWDKMGNPVQGVSDHAVLFSQLFGDGGMSVAQRRHLLNQKRSVLDAVMTDAQAVGRTVGADDQRKVQEYFDLIRNIEKRLARDETWLSRRKPEATLKQPLATAAGTAGIELMFDLLVAALQTNSTRVITYRLPTNSLLQEFGEENKVNPVGAHPMTHSGVKTSTGYQQLIWRDKKLCEIFATLLDKMKAIREPDGSTLLDNSLIAMGSDLRTGHKRRNLPILFAGGGGGGIRQGQHLVHQENETPLGNLWLSMLRHAGCRVDACSGSNGVLPGLFT